MFGAVLLPASADPNGVEAIESPRVRLVCAPSAQTGYNAPPANLHPAWPILQPPREELADRTSPAVRTNRVLALPLDSELYVLQPSGCNSGQQSSFPKCRPWYDASSLNVAYTETSITKAGNGDTCRFKNFRVFKNKSEEFEYGPWFADASSLERISEETTVTCLEDLLARKSAQGTETILLDIRDRHKISTTTTDEMYILSTTAPVLRSLIDSELQIISSFPSDKTLLRPLIQHEKFYTHGRHLCDECSTSLWNCCFTCIKCAREICFDCYRDAIPTTEEEVKGSCRFLAHKSRSKVRTPAHKCGNNMPVHLKDDFLLSLKISTPALKKMLTIVDLVLRNNISPAISVPKLHEEVPDDLNACHPAKFLKLDLQRDSEDYLRLSRNSVNAFARFKEEWEMGHAVVFEGGTDLIQADWSPTFFTEHYGGESANVVDCETKENITMTVKDFFKFFLDPELSRKQILKLPDWPPHSDFRAKFPDHYNDFLCNTPFLDYSGFTGCRNLAARLPVSYLPPDLGPKMYNAFGSSDAGDYGQGTTPIHLDMADAVNVMMYCSSSPADRPAAVWDIYALKDLPKLREYLNEYVERTGCAPNMEDCIHDQMFYLNQMMREELWKKKGVRAWRIFQNPGDAIFVPAGCAHQVCNYKDSIKSACDFVSPENLSACVQLTNEFRRLSKTHRRREDLLNLKSILWNVWKSSPLLDGH